MTKVIPCLTDFDAETPYVFKATGTSVYSYEEALYHFYAYWKQSLDDFLCEEFLDWVNDELKLNLLAARLKELPQANLPERYVMFLSSAEYFEKSALKLIKTELLEWETRREWEKLKERADFLMNRGDFSRALVIYRQAVTLSDGDAQTLNNAAIACMKLGLYAEGEEDLLKAVDVCPGNKVLSRNLAELYLLSGELEKCLALTDAVEDEFPADAACFRGRAECAKGAYSASVPHFKKAVALSAEPHYIFCLADTFVKLRRFDDAISAMDAVKVKDRAYLEKLSSLYVAVGNIPAAIREAERALLTDMSNARLWTRVASYYRMDYDLPKADNAIARATAIDKDDLRAALELARIRKAQGKTKDYQSILGWVLSRFKDEYREINNA